MLEIMVYLRYYKPTPEFHCWVDNEGTKLYIPKHSFPNSLPDFIEILITDNPEKTVDWDVRTEVIYEKAYDDAVRYEPTGISYDKIGKPVISKNFLESPYPEKLYIGIRWE
jgi:hypothetical protein